MGEEYVWYKYYQPGWGPHLDYPYCSIPELLDRTVAKYPDKVCTIFMGAKLTFRQVQEKSNRLAAALANFGVRKGSRVALMLPNTPQYVLSYLAVLRLGAIVVQMNPLYTEREIENILADSEAEAIIALDLFISRIEAVKPRTKLRTVIWSRVNEFLGFPLKQLYPLMAKRKNSYPAITPKAHLFNLSDLINSSHGRPPRVDIDPAEDVAIFQYTGGTTGIPKAAMCTHMNMVANCYQARAIVGDTLIEGRERGIGLLPFFHSYGLTTNLNLLIAFGGTMILCPQPNDFKQVLGLIRKYKPTLFNGVPTMYIGILNHPDLVKTDMSSIKVLNSGAAAMPVEVMNQFEAKTGGRIVEGYGLSEASPVVTCNPFKGTRKPGSIGIPLPDTIVKIVDMETGTRELPPGEVGELVVKGPQVMKGYWNRPEETAQVLRDGWLYTGDVAKMDEDGFFYIVDRKKDMIITGGFNVYPREVEEVIYEHPKVKEVAVVGVPDEYAGERIKAVVVPKEGQTLTEDEIRQWCRNKLTGYKVPRIVEFRDELPLTMVGKVLRRVLKEEAVAEAAKEGTEKGA